MNRAVPVAVLFVLIILPVAGSAQVGPVGLIQMPPLFGEFRPVEGFWVEYKVHETDSDSIMNIRLGIAGHEKCFVAVNSDEGAAAQSKSSKAAKTATKAAVDCYWVEIITQIPDGPSAAVKIYTDGDPRRPQNILRLLSRAGKRQPIEAKPEALKKIKKMPGGLIPENARTTKRDTISIEGYSEKIPATVYEFRSDSVPYVEWYSDRVPLFGVAKIQAPNLNIQVIGFGKNFKTTFPDVDALKKKDDTIEKPDKLDLKKPGQGGLEESKDKVKDDYLRPSKNEGEEPEEQQ